MMPINRWVGKEPFLVDQIEKDSRSYPRIELKTTEYLNPVAGTVINPALMIITVPSGESWIIKGITGTLFTTVTLGERVMHMIVQDTQGTKIWETFNGPLNPDNTFEFTWLPNQGSSAVRNIQNPAVNWVVDNGIPDITLVSGCRIVWELLKTANTNDTFFQAICYERVIIE